MAQRLLCATVPEIILKCFVCINLFTFHGITPSVEKACKSLSDLLKGTLQVRKQSSEAGLPAPVFTQRRINWDPYASCLVLSADSKCYRIKSYQNKAGGNQE